jgi:hypothetical protein
MNLEPLFFAEDVKPKKDIDDDNEDSVKKRSASRSENNFII